jgi:leader peptidase (prepilin peptidase) / N-methyltransferase
MPDLSNSALWWLMAAWLLLGGGAIGSFLNVVVYRLPLGISLIAPGSHCPACKRPIRWHDNVPVLGWLMLRGRCRDCGSAISPRYPAVEAITSAMFVSVGLIQGPACGGFRLVLLCTLLCALLIRFDGNRPPLRLFVPAIVIGLLAPLIWPEIRPSGMFMGDDSVFSELIADLVGPATGLLMGGLILLLGSRIGGLKRPLEAIFVGPWLASCACVGLYLNWQGVCATVPLSAAAYFAMQALGGRNATIRQLPAVGYLAICVLIWTFLA